MNYEKSYHTIILSARTKDRKKSASSIYERHHILPKSLGGLNTSDNLVLLTPKEHFVCHLLLVEIYRGTEHYAKMNFAMWCLVNGNTNQKRYTPSAKQYQRIRIDLVKLVRERGRIRGMPKQAIDAASKSNTGKKRTSQTRDKMRKAKLNVKREPWVIDKLKESFKGRVYKPERNENISKSKMNHEVSIETREKLSRSLIGRPSPKKGKPLTKEHIEKLKKAKQNISQETRDKMSASRKGKIPWNKKLTN